MSIDKNSPKIIVGLGNPGKKYVNTRHNAGFKAVDSLSAEYNCSLKRSLTKRCYIGFFELSGIRVILAKPVTFMNNSGICFKRLIDKYRLGVQNCLVIYDDVYLPLGTIRFRSSGSAGGHNGMESIIDYAGTENISRLRIGIRTEGIETDGLADYVLSDFLQEEAIIIDKKQNVIINACRDWLISGNEYVMNKYNNSN